MLFKNKIVKQMIIKKNEFEHQAETLWINQTIFRLLIPVTSNTFFK